VGRDSRISGEMVKSVCIGTLVAKGLDVIDIGICPTPTVQYAVKIKKAAGGIAISASHNPNEWNALKLLNSTGQFLSPEEFEIVNKSVNTPSKGYNKWNELGKSSFFHEGLELHKEAVLQLKYIDFDAIKERKFKVLVDCVNGAGYVIIPKLLREFGCEVIEMNCESSGIFPRLPEPLPENLVDTMNSVKESKADLGIVVDPDVDRLVLITDKGEPFSEENTITQAVKFILSKEHGNVVVNLSTTRGVDDVASEYNCKVFRSPVGEANVVKKMKDVGAIIGGEGSGGVIYPALHYGRDALVGVAITLQHLLEYGGTMDELKKSLPQYTIVKRKIELDGSKSKNIIDNIVERFKYENINTEDGVRVDFDDHWVHFRKSNTEPILRIIVEAKSAEIAGSYIEKYMELLKD